MAAVVRTPLAEADLDGILTDLDEKNPAAAERYATRFADKADFLSRFPEAGRPGPEIAPDVRSTLSSLTSSSIATTRIPFTSFASCTADATCAAS
jgi:plasmid stabilization system protein ParE